MNFGEALQALMNGKKVKRSIWSGYWYYSHKAKLLTTPLDNEGAVYREDNTLDIIVAVLKDNGGVAPAQPYQSDLLADDWQIVE